MKRRIFYLLFFILTLGCTNHPDPKWDFKSFYKPVENPVLRADSSFTFMDPIKKEPVRWQRADVFNPAAIVRNNKVYMLYRSEDNPAAILGGRTSRIGLATSEDGIHFTKYPTPVLYPDSSEFMKYDYPGGCEDPRIVQTEDSTYVLAYTSWNYKIARLSIAFSRDLIHWEKKGPAFVKADSGKFLDIWSKSGSIITKKVGDKIVAAKINGKYGM
jgi:beta-1,2-mannosidase